MIEKAGLDQLDPTSTHSRDASHFRAIIGAAKDVHNAEEALRRAVDQARAAGDSWAIIGAALDISRQAAQQRFGRAND